MMQIPKTIVYIIVGTGTYYIMEKFFPEQKDVKPRTDVKLVRGGDEIVRVPIWRRLVRNRSLKVGVIAVFVAHIGNLYNAELIALLTDASIINVAKKGSGKCAKLISRFAAKNGITDAPESLREIVVNQSLTFDKKSELFKNKIEYIITRNFPGKKKYLLLLVFGMMIACALTSVGGLAVILDALRKLFEKGKISEALYEELRREAISRAKNAA